MNELTYPIPDYCGGVYRVPYDVLDRPDAREVIMAELCRRLAARQAEEDEAMLAEHDDAISEAWEAWREGLAVSYPKLFVPRWTPQEVRKVRELVASMGAERAVGAVGHAAAHWQAYAGALRAQGLHYADTTPSPSVSLLVREPIALLLFAEKPGTGAEGVPAKMFKKHKHPCVPKSHTKKK